MYFRHKNKKKKAIHNFWMYSALLLIILLIYGLLWYWESSSGKLSFPVEDTPSEKVDMEGK